MKTNAKKLSGVKVLTAIKAGAFSVNHVRVMRGLKVTTGIKAGDGIQTYNHNRRLT